MKTIVLAVLAMLLLGAAAAAILANSQKTAYVAYATGGARVSEPGTNLVGARWTGDI